MKTDNEFECPFCNEGTMREDSCGCLTCRKCHRVEGQTVTSKHVKGLVFRLVPKIKLRYYVSN